MKQSRKNELKRAFVMLSAILFLQSCSKNYTYVEEYMEKGLLGGSSTQTKEETFLAKTDSAAYMEAFRKYAISMKVYNDLRKQGMGEYLKVPLRFILLNNKGEDITNVFFATKAKYEEETISRLQIINAAENTAEEEPVEIKIDSAKINELLPFFRVKKDEFDPRGKTWYEPKGAPQYTNRNGIYLYFGVQEGKPLSLRFRIQYYAEDWLFFKKVQFSIDDNAFEYIPSNTETDSGYGGKIWEWFDEPLNKKDRELIYALANANLAKMKFIGRQYYDIKTITKEQIKDIKRVLELYIAMGGDY